MVTMRLGVRSAALVAGGRVPAAALSQTSPEFVENNAPGVKSTRAWVRRVRRNMRSPPRVTEGLSEALGGERKGGGGSARHDSPACAFVRCSGLEDGGKRLWPRAQCKSKCRQGLRGAALRGGVPATADRGCAAAERRPCGVPMP